MSDPNYQRTTAASRKAAMRLSYSHFCGGTPKRAAVRVPGKVYNVGATKRKALRWHDKQAAKLARRLAKVAA